MEANEMIRAVRIICETELVNEEVGVLNHLSEEKNNKNRLHRGLVAVLVVYGARSLIAVEPH